MSQQPPFNLKIAQDQNPLHYNFLNIFVLLLLHIGAIAALFCFSWPRFFVMLGLYFVSCLGITIGFHRLLTHRSFSVAPWLEYLLAVMGCFALQGGPINWVAEHRQHHNYSDTDLDPHDIHHGFWHAHMGWLFKDHGSKYIFQIRSHFAPDLMKNKFYLRLEKLVFLPSALAGLACLLLGGWPMFLWGFCLRHVLVYHATWFVNSAAHLWGYRPFEKHIATNNWWVGALAMGEGWHNNHHAFPTSARHGLRFWEFDLSWVLIWVGAKLNLVKRVKLPSSNELPWKKSKSQVFATKQI